MYEGASFSTEQFYKIENGKFKATKNYTNGDDDKPILSRKDYLRKRFKADVDGIEWTSKMSKEIFKNIKWIYEGTICDT
eukprot:UN06759